MSPTTIFNNVDDEEEEQPAWLWVMKFFGANAVMGATAVEGWPGDAALDRV